MGRKLLNSIILVRHAECYKNVRDEHGGKGDVLTKKGKKQLLSLSKKIDRLNIQHQIPANILFYSDVNQIKQTAEYLSIKLGVPARVDERIVPLNLGILDGLSKEEAMTKFPDEASQLEKWRSGMLEIRNLQIPCAESFDTFWKRGKSFIFELTKNSTSAIVIGSRSVLILLMNILLDQNPYVDGKYYPYDFSCASIAYFSYTNKWNSIYMRGVRTVDGEVLKVQNREGIPSEFCYTSKKVNFLSQP